MSSGNIYHISDYTASWKKVFEDKGPNTTLTVHMNDGTGEVEVALMNHEGEVISTVISTVNAAVLMAAIEAFNGTIVGSRA